MPELPEVQTVVDDLNAAGLVGDVVTDVACYWTRTLANVTQVECQKRLMGKQISQVSRRGKNIVFSFTGEENLVIHLRMSGRLHIKESSQPKEKHEHFILSLKKSGQLRFHDTRKFGKVYCVKDLDSFFEKLGIEPLEKDFTSAWLHRNLHAKKRKIKPLLLDQSFIAGLGNIYVDEALWDAQIHPERSSDSISKEESTSLAASIKKVLRRGLKNMGTTLGTGKGNFYSVASRRGRNSDALKVFRRNGEPCPRCGNVISKMIVGQRGTHVCNNCQTV